MSNFDKFLISIQLFEEYHLERRKALHANKLIRLDAVKSFIRSYYGDLYKEYKELNLDKDVRARNALHKAEELHNEVDELITEKNAIRFLDKVARFKDYLLILQKVYVEDLDKQIQNMEKYYQWITDLKRDDIQLLTNDETDDAYDKAVILYEETMRHLGKEPEEEEIIFTFGKCRALSGAEDIDFKGVIYAAKPEGIDCEFTFCVNKKEELITTKDAETAAADEMSLCVKKSRKKKKLKSKNNDAVRVAEDTTAEDITKDTRAENEPKETSVTNDEPVEVSHEVISTEAEPEVKADEQEDAEEKEEVVKESTPKPFEVDSSIDAVEKEVARAEQVPKAAVTQETRAAPLTLIQHKFDCNINSTVVADEGLGVIKIEEAIEGKGQRNHRTSDEAEVYQEETVAEIRRRERPDRKPNRLRCRVWPPAECLKYFKHIFKNISV